MSRVLRPSWGHEIRRYLWQFSLGQAFVDWLKYSRYYVFSYGRYFWKHLVSLSCLAYDVWWIFEFGDSSLMISDSSFCRASDIHIRAYYPFSLRFLVVVGRYPYWRIFLSPWWDCVRAAIHKWMNIVGCLPHNFDIGYHIGAYSPLFGEILFGQWYEDGWYVLVIYLTTLISDLILGHISPFSLSILEIETMAILVLYGVLVWSFWRLAVSELSYMDLLR